MHKTIFFIAGLLTSFGFGFFINTNDLESTAIYNSQTTINTNTKTEDHMKLGAFSVSLNVKDIVASKKMYENLGFTVFAESMEQNYLIMKNENSLIGIFQGMFQGDLHIESRLGRKRQ